MSEGKKVLIKTAIFIAILVIMLYDLDHPVGSTNDSKKAIFSVLFTLTCVAASVWGIAFRRFIRGLYHKRTRDKYE